MLQLDTCVYVKPDVVKINVDLPDGVYELSLDGRSFKIAKSGGKWHRTFHHAVV
ncbi:hypothetical protein [Occallatibacter savannae]|uniref:hypothetical protein n=1 Tax=Occallatibacter savannae TaxID=1002691 RepID=UPI0013A54C97|nr:hypothetical protein [Occallatibacter savannae]